MNRRRLVVLLGGVGTGAAVVLTLVLGVFSTGAEDVVDPESVAIVSNAAVEVGAAAVASPADGTAEGIKLHGHWIIEVRDPDGTVVNRREFDNALTECGAAALRGLTARTMILDVNPWSIVLIDGEFGDVFFEEPERTFSTGRGSSNMVLTSETTVSSPEGVTITEAITLIRPTDLNGEEIGPTDPRLAECQVLGGSLEGVPIFTREEIAALIVEFGQRIQVTVGISFF